MEDIYFVREGDQYVSTSKPVQDMVELAKGSYGKIFIVKNGKIMACKEEKLKKGYLSIGQLMEMDILSRLGDDNSVLKLLGVQITSDVCRYYFNYINSTLTAWYRHHNLETRLANFESIFNKLITNISQLHNNGVYHQDIKPSNILVMGDQMIDKLFIIDFGLSRISTESVKSRQTYYTYLYRPPELYFPKSKFCVDSSDSWAIAMCMLEVITGKRLFDGVAEDKIKAKLISYITKKSATYEQELYTNSHDYYFDYLKYLKDNMPESDFNKISIESLQILNPLMAIRPKNRPSPIMIAKFLNISIPEHVPLTMVGASLINLEKLITILNKLPNISMMAYLTSIEIYLRMPNKEDISSMIVAIRLGITLFQNKLISYPSLCSLLNIFDLSEIFLLNCERRMLADISFKLFNPALWYVFVRVYNLNDNDNQKCLTYLSYTDARRYMRPVNEWFIVM
jgi:serine/threonine protein kinase